MEVKKQDDELKLNIQIPVEITIKFGKPISVKVANVNIDGELQKIGDIDSSFETIKNKLLSDFGSDIINIRKGYRFKDGWIEDEKVIVVEVNEKLKPEILETLGKKSIPSVINGVKTDVRSVALPDQPDELKKIEIDQSLLERKAQPAGYQEPPGFDDPNSEVFLGRIQDEKMDAIFHVSPDIGFKNLSAFFSRIKNNLTATIYEWQVNHISDALASAMSGNKKLKMVTQRTGVAESDATIKAVDDMKIRIKKKFKHVYASTRGPGRLIPNSYHIKVASRDDEEFWLSSGNWKKSNQPKNPKVLNDLDELNREWHVIIRNEKLAKLFRTYIDYDFEQATKFPLTFKTKDEESIDLSLLEFFVPINPFEKNLEKIVGATYAEELRIVNEVIDIHPLLTPDKDKDGNQLFIKQATEMIKRATQSIYIQNQSFNMTDDNNVEVQEFFDEVRKKQKTLDDVRIIMRDASDFPVPGSIEKQQQLIERLKDFGFNVSRNKLKLQPKCHTKAIIIDSSEVLMGSQNLTNGGALYNRDASLLIRNDKVAKFFEEIFLYDWNNLAHNNSNERVGRIRRANPNEKTPNGFRKVKLADIVGEIE